jgi:hypothetical protein
LNPITLATATDKEVFPYFARFEAVTQLNIRVSARKTGQFWNILIVSSEIISGDDERVEPKG